MALVTINDVDVLGGTIMMPLVGVWTADLVVDQTDGTGFAAGTAVTIKTDSFELSGVVAADRTGDFLDAVHIRVLGGKGGMGKTATARGYAQPGALVRDVANGLASDAGESLSSTTHATFLGTNLVAWAVMTAPIAQALETLIKFVSPDSNWRILADGTLWIGSESWPAASPQFDILEHNPTDGIYVLGVDSPFIQPGTTLDEVGQVNRVQHEIMDNKIRSTVWTSLENDRGLSAAIGSLVRHETAKFDYFAMYESTVKAQSADLTTVDVAPEVPNLPGLGRVLLRHGLPGCKVQVASGCKVLLGWKGGDPSKPFAAIWSGGETVVKTEIKATSLVLNDGVLGAARQTDQVTGTAGPYPIASGQIAAGSTSVKIG